MGLEELEDQMIAGRFRLKKMVGRGGYGAVFEAVQLSVSRRCALKILLPERGQDESVIKRFRAEARLTSQLTHPNSVVVYDFGVDDHRGYLYLATEFLDGKTLYEIIKARGRLPAAAVLSILEQVAGSLADAHRQGMVHRDIKLKNIMVVRRAGKDDFAKVIDFGIAKAFAGDCGEELTRTGMLVGTPQYMAPEQLQGGPIDGRADQYALAVLGYRLLVGENPFYRESPMETAMCHINDQARPLRSYFPDLAVNSEFEAVFLKALAKAPSSRFAEIVDFTAALRQAHSGEASPKRLSGNFLWDEQAVRAAQKSTMVLAPVTEENSAEAAEEATGVLSEADGSGLEGGEEATKIVSAEGETAGLQELPKSLPAGAAQRKTLRVDVTPSILAEMEAASAESEPESEREPDKEEEPITASLQASIQRRVDEGEETTNTAEVSVPIARRQDEDGNARRRTESIPMWFVAVAATVSLAFFLILVFVFVADQDSPPATSAVQGESQIDGEGKPTVAAGVDDDEDGGAAEQSAASDEGEAVARHDEEEQPVGDDEQGLHGADPGHQPPRMEDGEADSDGGFRDDDNNDGGEAVEEGGHGAQPEPAGGNYRYQQRLGTVKEEPGEVPAPSPENSNRRERHDNRSDSHGVADSGTEEAIWAID